MREGGRVRERGREKSEIELLDTKNTMYIINQDRLFHRVC